MNKIPKAEIVSQLDTHTVGVDSETWKEIMEVIKLYAPEGMATSLEAEALHIPTHIGWSLGDIISFVIMRSDNPQREDCDVTDAEIEAAIYVFNESDKVPIGDCLHESWAVLLDEARSTVSISAYKRV